MSRIFAISCIAASLTYPSSRWARNNNGITAERLPSGGYFDRICFTSFGYFSARLIGQYLRARYQWKRESLQGQPPGVLETSFRWQTSYQMKVYASGHDAVWVRHRLRDRHPTHHAAIQPHYTQKLSAQEIPLSTT